MSKQAATTKKARSAKSQASKFRPVTVTITYHEQMLLVIYRTLTDQGRAAVDHAVSYEWAGRHKGVQQSAQEISDGNARFGKAVREVAADHAAADGIVYFANLWTRAATERADAEKAVR